MSHRGEDTMKPEIARTYTRKYSDNDQIITYVEWLDGSRTEGDARNPHMNALVLRAGREGKPHKFETW